MKNIVFLFNVINRSLFRIEPQLSYSRTIEAITKLARLVHEFENENDNSELWSLGESGDCDLTSLLIGAYWFCAEYHGGQTSLEYACLSALGDVYNPGPIANGPEEDGAESYAYDQLIARSGYVVAESE